MPELPEVQTVVSTLAPRVTERVIARVRLHRTDIVEPPGIDLSSLLTGQRIQSIHRRAKRIVFTLGNGCRFFIHLGMTGRLTLENARSPLLPHTHMVIQLAHGPGSARHAPQTPSSERSDDPGSTTTTQDSGLSTQHLSSANNYRLATTSSPSQDYQEIRFCDPRRFGGIFWLGCDLDPGANLGPEPLTLRPMSLQRLLAQTTRPIKSALLDQTLIAGLGNIYADEALFVAGIHPLTPADRIPSDNVRLLNRAIKRVLRKAIRFKGSTLRDFVDADGVVGSYRQHHLVYDREGELCPRCRKTAIQRIVLSGRSTCFCPRCQKKP